MGFWGLGVGFQVLREGGGGGGGLLKNGGALGVPDIYNHTYIHTYVHKYMHTHAHQAGGCKRGLFCRDCVRVICSCSTHRLRVYSLEFRAQRLVFRVGFGAW